MEFAVIAAGGKQHVVTTGTRLRLDYAAAAPGATVRFPALLRSRADGEVVLGHPTVSGTVTAKVVSVQRSPKITVIKFKRKVRYRRKVGHRYPTSVVEITALR